MTLTLPDRIARRDHANGSMMLIRFHGLTIVCLLLSTNAPGKEDVQRAADTCRQAPKAAERVRACSAVIRSTTNDTIAAQAYNRRGLANVELQRFDEAADDFSHVIRHSPKVAGYYDNRQNALRQVGRLDDALRDAEKAVQLAPTYTFVFRGRGLVYQDMGKLDQAVADFTRAVTLDPRDTGLRMDRARLYARKGQDQLAVKDLTEAFNIDPLNRRILHDRGIIYAKLAAVADAISDLSSYLDDFPDDSEARQTLDRLKSSSPSTTTH